MLRNLSRTGYASLAFSQEQGIILKLFLVREQGQSFGVPTAHPHPKIGGVALPGFGPKAYEDYDYLSVILVSRFDILVSVVF